MKVVVLILVWLAARVLPAEAWQASDDLTRFSYSQYHMGVDAQIVVYAPSKAVAEEACAAAFARIATLDSIMSDYRRGSELNRLCDRAAAGPVRISASLFKVLRRAREVSIRSGGAFDITVGPVVKLWREAAKSGKAPDPAKLAAARKLVDWRRVLLDASRRTAELTTPGTRLDLGGIGKGYAADEALRVLRGRGIPCALVQMGGDIRVGSPPPGKQGWSIRVPNASEGKPLDLPFANCAVSTSGDTEQFAMIDGVRYSHVVDPRTGKALTRRTQATIVAADGLTSDPLATAATVLDGEARDRLLRSYGVRQSYFKTLPGP